MATRIGIVFLLFLLMLPAPTAIAQQEKAADSPPAVQEDHRESNIIASRRLLEVVRNGGPLMIPIGICSFILLVFVFERSISLRKSRIIPRPFVRRFLEQLNEGALDRDEALQLCERNSSHHAFLRETIALD